VTVDRRAVLLGVIAAGIAGRSAGQTAPPAGAHPAPAGLPQPTETLDLWPDGAPGMPHAPPVEIVTERSTDAQVTDRAVLGISGPRLAVFRQRLPNGAAVVIAPGGGGVRRFNDYIAAKKNIHAIITPLGDGCWVGVME
jgi:hypothetical protein